jgi:hypothetical protein
MRRALIALSLAIALPSFAVDVLRPLVHHTTSAVKTTEPPLRASAKSAAIIVARTTGAHANDIAALRAANATGDGALKLGVVRELDPVEIASAQSEGPFRWRGAVQVNHAKRIRVRLDDVVLPAGSRLWVYPASGPAVEVSASLVYHGQLWTPSVAGDLVTIEIDAPRQASFRIGAVIDARDAAEVAPNAAECIVDISCHANAIDASFSRAYAQYEAVSGTHLVGCTGALLNNVREDGTPYFLTARHCVRNEQEASTIDAVWDYRSTSCNAATPPRLAFARTVGATFLASDPESDATLVQLSGVPANRTFLGWDSRPLQNGTTLIHISHPGGRAQRYSTSVVDTTVNTCSTSPRPAFVYSRQVVGAIDVGSSGAPAMTAEGLVVGQLKARCGPDRDDPCHSATKQVDGALSESFATLRTHLDPAPACEACTPNATTACMLGNRFKVTIAWTDAPYGTGAGKPIRYAENVPQTHPEHGPILETAFFSFYDFFPGSVETMVKMTKGAGINDKFWIFVTGFTGASYTVNVQDTKTCATWSKDIPANATALMRDYEAFPLP